MKMEKCVWVIKLLQQEEWKFVSVVYGEECVIPTGILVMPELLVEILDYHLNVSYLN